MMWVSQLLPHDATHLGRLPFVKLLYRILTTAGGLLSLHLAGVWTPAK